MQKLKNLYLKYRGSDLRTLAYPVLLIYWGIMVEALGPSVVKLYEGSRILELDACGLELEACCLGLEACGLMLNKLGA
jgi:hypothetical protein